jgi:hypothetical protein
MVIPDSPLFARRLDALGITRIHAVFRIRGTPAGDCFAVCHNLYGHFNPTPYGFVDSLEGSDLLEGRIHSDSV